MAETKKANNKKKKDIRAKDHYRLNVKRIKRAFEKYDQKITSLAKVKVFLNGEQLSFNARWPKMTLDFILCDDVYFIKTRMSKEKRDALKAKREATKAKNAQKKQKNPWES